MSGVLERLEAELDMAMAFGTPGDRALMLLSAYSDPWFTGDNQAQSVSLVVPSEDVFYADTLNIYLQARRFDQANPLTFNTDLTWRPAMWVTTANQLLAGGAFNYVQDANASWKMSDTFNGTYQGDTGLSIGAAYSARYGQSTVFYETPQSEWVGARKFFVPQKLPRGSTATITLTPSFGRVSNTTVKTQFRVAVILSGHKIVRRGV
jgi:hypothetical protein